jgi:hypothetical protein
MSGVDYAVHTNRDVVHVGGAFKWEVTCDLYNMFCERREKVILLYLLNRLIGKCGIYLHKIVQSFLDN